jgi:3-deoxy-D-manno-octulosonate 8-phosphate phosphatase (KDO 8-P phosphatase)
MQGVELALITARSSGIVSRRAAELGIEHLYQGSVNKLDAFHELLSETGLDAEQVCYAGDDWLDIPVLDRAGLAVTVADGDPVVKTRVHYITERPGGHGAVREICDLILAARGLDDAALEGILSP